MPQYETKANPAFRYNLGVGIDLNGGRRTGPLLSSRAQKLCRVSVQRELRYYNRWVFLVILEENLKVL